MNIRLFAVLLLVEGVQVARPAEIRISLDNETPRAVAIEVLSSIPGLSYDIAFAPTLSDPFEILLRGTSGQRLFQIAIPASSSGFFRAVEISNPLLNDFDEDGISNEEELTRGTYPFALDSDGDGISDKDDISPLNPTEGVRLVFDPADHEPPTISLDVPTDAVLIR